jgi:hypothetical protein
MTQRWLHGIKRTIDFTPEHDISVQVVAQGLEDPPLVVGNPQRVAVTHSDLNLGFARGMNLAIKEGLARCGFQDYVVVLNNDCSFPEVDWLRNLLAEANGQVLVPLNTRCNTSAIVASEPGDGPPFTMPFVPAVCWAVPMEWILKIYMRYGYYLFDPAFHVGWCEDNYAAWVFRKLFDPDPFRIVPKSWIQHKGSVTVDDQIRQRGVGFTKDNEALLRRKTRES